MDFSAKLQSFAASAPRPGEASRPVITISTNPRAGTLGSSIANQTLTQAMGVVNGKVGERVSAEVAQQTGGAPLAGGVALVLGHPIDVQTTVHNPLPNGTGNGLSAFYYSLPLLLAGFATPRGSIAESAFRNGFLE